MKHVYGFACPVARSNTILNREADLNQLNASFRNPPSLFTRGDYASHDAEHETEALLDAYVNHDNTPPFVAKTLIQRFVTSNPSPRYVKAVSTAFKTGKHNDFGAGKRGDLVATLAAVLLDREASSAALDSDSSVDGMREPMTKLIHLMRALEFTPRRGLDEVSLAYSVKGRNVVWGQQPYDAPDIFSWFHTDYQPSGALKQAGMAFFNGALSLIKSRSLWGQAVIQRGLQQSQNDACDARWFFDVQSQQQRNGSR